MEIFGRCYCGAVQYVATGPPEEVDACSCADCTRSVGAVTTVWARFATDQFAFTRGKPRRFESSPGITRTFCADCGSSLTYHYANGEKVDVTTATLDDPKAFRIADAPNRAKPTG